MKTRVGSSVGILHHVTRGVLIVAILLVSGAFWFAELAVPAFLERWDMFGLGQSPVPGLRLVEVGFLLFAISALTLCYGLLRSRSWVPSACVGWLSTGAVAQVAAVQHFGSSTEPAHLWLAWGLLTAAACLGGSRKIAPVP